jgi:hypothetical protein
MLIKQVIIATALLTMSSLSQAGLVSHYDFDGNTLDGSGNGNHGYATADAGRDPVSFSSDTHDGTGSSAVFNNNTVLALEQPYNTPSALSSLSLSVWFKTGAAWVPDGATIADTTNWSFIDFDRSEYFNLSVSGEGKAWFGFTHLDNQGSSITTDVFSDVSSLHDNQWHHIYLSYGTQYGLKMFVDGALEADHNYYGAIGNGSTRYGFIGDGSEATTYDGAKNNVYYDGLLDDLSFWDNEDGLTLSSNFSSGSLYSVSSVSPVSPMSLLTGLFLLGVWIRKRA